MVAFATTFERPDGAGVRREGAAPAEQAQRGMLVGVRGLRRPAATHRGGPGAGVRLDPGSLRDESRDEQAPSPSPRRGDGQVQR